MFNDIIINNHTIYVSISYNVVVTFCGSVCKQNDVVFVYTYYFNANSNTYKSKIKVFGPYPKTGML